MSNYFQYDELAEKVWKDKYQLNNETLEEFFDRITNEFVRLDNFTNTKNLTEEQLLDLSPYGLSRINLDRKEQFLNLFKNFKYIIPGGSVLAGIGSTKPVSLSNCFVTPTSDSISGIFGTATDMSQIYKRRGGNGTDLSSIRPKGAPVNNASKTTGGVVPFMKLFSQVTNTIGQDGRRGALMLSLDINHPDSPDFITSKQDLTQITGANISVKLNKEFKKAIENNEDYILRWPCEYDISNISKNEIEELPYNILRYYLLSSEKSHGYIKKIKAKELWDSIIECAWNTGEPGILLWDNIIDNDPASVYPEFKPVSTNPLNLAA